MVFPAWTNSTPAIFAALGGVAVLGVIAGITYYFTPEYWEVGYEPTQPIDYNHQLHAGQLGIDCRYCHTHVEESGHANVPDTATCMNCHTGEGETGYLNAFLWQRHRGNENLVRLRAAYAEDAPIPWRRIHKVPHYAHFPHHVHVKAGISCYSCHGRMDRQEVARQVESLSMAWCLDCHRDPEPYLVDNTGLLGQPVDVTNLDVVNDLLEQKDYADLVGGKLAEMKQLDPPEHCGACHY